LYQPTNLILICVLLCFFCLKLIFQVLNLVLISAIFEIKKMIKKYILFLFSLISFSFFSQVKIDSVFQSFKNEKAFVNSSVSFLVKHLDSNAVLFNYNDSLCLTSASTVKLITTATAFETLGKNYKPSTLFYVNQLPDKDGVVYGDLIIKGGGDISFASQYFNHPDSLEFVVEKWVDSLIKLNVKVIRGDLIGDGSLFGYEGAPNGWAWEDLGNYYGAFPSGLSIFDNQLKYQFYVGAPKTRPILINTFPEIPNLTLKNSLVSLKGVGDNSWVYGGPYSYERSIKGSLSANNKSFIVKGSLPDPELQFLQVFKKAFDKKGIILEGKVLGVRMLDDSLKTNYANKKIILKIDGASVSEIAYWTNLKSLNVFAETLASWIGLQKTGLGTVSNGVEVIQDYWKNKIFVNGLNLTDGSGLSRTNSISSKTFCSLLQYMYYSKNRDDFMNTLPVSGQTGTLSYFCKGQCSEGKIMAKSGTMRGVKSYAGYVKTQSGKTLAFSIIINNFNCSSTYLMKRLEPIMNAMYLQ
jgi:D-alanyl-D-alanine carboxypeptidase/D-alanyl-D-alanine-endopeptidase (penicillin-binding protein 4)